MKSGPKLAAFLRGGGEKRTLVDPASPIGPPLSIIQIFCTTSVEALTVRKQKGHIKHYTVTRT